MQQLVNSPFSSTSSGIGGVPMFTPEEVGSLLHLDRETIKWLREEPPNDDSPVLVLSYQNAFVNYGNFERNKAAISSALISSGATLISDNVFKFDNWATMYEARRRMQANMLWAFFVRNDIIGQRNGLSQLPTITTTAISWFTDGTGKLTVQPYEFFEM